ncbi:MAG: hypothetical protein ACTS7I_01445 [Candidatus Hodgkinia cicadicola]
MSAHCLMFWSFALDCALIQVSVKPISLLINRFRPPQFNRGINLLTIC